MNRTQNIKTMQEEKKISISDLLNFIKINASVVNALGCVDLNDITNNVKTFALKKLEFQDVQRVTYLPPHLSQIFDIEHEKYLHAGCLKFCSNTNNDITLYSSIITCLKHLFSTQSVQNQELFISKLLLKLKKESVRKYEMFNYKLFNWGKNDIANDISNYAIGKNILKYLSDYFHINIFILDIEEDELYYASGENFVPFKKNIFLLKYSDESFEPFYSEHAKTMSANDIIIKKIVNDMTLLISTNIKNELKPIITVVNEDLAMYKPKMRDIEPRYTKEDYKLECQRALEDIDEPITTVVHDDTLNAFVENSSDDENKKLIPTSKVLTIKEKSIWVKSISESDSSSSSSSSSSLSDKDIKPTKISTSSSVSNLVTMKLTLTELATIATKHKIPTKDKNGKNKTKTVLVSEINKKINSV